MQDYVKATKDWNEEAPIVVKYKIAFLNIFVHNVCWKWFCCTAAIKFFKNNFYELLFYGMIFLF